MEQEEQAVVTNLNGIKSGLLRMELWCPAFWSSSCEDHGQLGRFGEAEQYEQVCAISTISGSLVYRALPFSSPSIFGYELFEDDLSSNIIILKNIVFIL